MTTHSSILAWRIPCTEEPGGGRGGVCGYGPWDHKESDMTEQLTLFTFYWECSQTSPLEVNLAGSSL